MKNDKPTFLVLHGASFKADPPDGFAVSDDRITLASRRRYFAKKAISGPWNGIRAFSVGAHCSSLLILDGDGRLWHYYADTLACERVGSGVTVQGNPSGMAAIGDVLVLANAAHVSALSPATWQGVWSHGGLAPGALASDGRKVFYLFDARPDAADRKILAMNEGGELLQTLYEGTLGDVVSLACRNGALYVLESVPPAGAEQNYGANIITGETRVSLTGLPGAPSGLAVSAKGELYLGCRAEGADGDGTIRGYRIDETGQAVCIDTIANYHGSVRGMAFDCADRLWVFDAEGAVTPVLQEPVYRDQAAFVHRFDSRLPRCRWHRLQLDVSLPSGTAMVLEVAAGDQPSEAPPTAGWTRLASNAEDALLPELRGRYLWLKAHFHADAPLERSPRLHLIRVHFPRETYLQYLPAVYREDEEGSALLEKYLSLFQTVLEGIEEKIAGSHTVIDPETAGSGYLDWLSSWLGLVRDERWPEATWRKFLLMAPGFFKKRGTREGLSEILALYLGKAPFIIEPFQAACEAGGAKLLDLDDYTFCVVLKPGQAEGETALAVVKKIVDTWKPAHTCGNVVTMRNQLILGGYTLLGVNTYLTENAFILGKAVLPFDTALATRDKHGRIERNARLGLDTKLL